MRVADYVAEFLALKGIRTVFMLSGGGMMHLMDGLACRKDLTVVCNHHEQASGMSAEGYARARNGASVCFGTSGPGGTNLVTSIAGAWTDSTPVMYFTGQSKLSQTIQNSGILGLRQYGTFEVDIVSIVKPITKFSRFVSDASLVPELLESAYQAAISGRPGPVLLDFPVDIQGATLPDLVAAASERQVAPKIDLGSLVDKWAAAKRPLLWLGHGIRVAGQVSEVEALLRLTGTPAVTTMLAKDVLSYDDECFVGHPGVKGDRAGNWAVQSADFILFLGSSLHVLNTGYEMDKFAPDAYKVQIDIDEAHFLREKVAVNEKISLTVEAAIRALAESWLRLDASAMGWERWKENLQRLKKQWPVSAEGHVDEPGRLNLFHVMDAVNATTPPQSLVVTDAGSAFYVVGQGLRTKAGQRVLSSGGLGCMGWALPASMGASFALPHLPILCITGDGSLQTNIHELAGLSGSQRNVKVLVLNNSGYLSIKNTQDNYFQGRHLGVDKESGVHMPNLALLCQAYALRHITITTYAQLESQLAQELASEGPVVLDIQCNVDQLIIPTVSSSKRADGSMESRPLEDMAPFLSRDVLRDILAGLRQSAC